MTENLQTSQHQLAEQRATSVYDKVAELKITDLETYLLMGDLLREVKKIVNTFEEETRPEIQQAYQLHKALIARKRKWSDKFEEAANLAKDKLELFYLKQKDAGLDLPKVDGVSFSETWTGEVEDISQLPREYLVPDIPALLAITRRLKEATAIAGWKVKKGITIAVRQ